MRYELRARMSHPMITLSDQENSLINECVGRLRLIQADSAHLPPDQRREFLNEEINRSFNRVPPANRKRYLEALLVRFPVAGCVATRVVETAAPPPPPPRPETPDGLLEKFIVAAAREPEEKRAEFAKRLAGASLVWVDRDALVLEISQEFQQSLGLKSDQQVHLSRVVDLCGLLIDMLSRLDERGVATMRELSARSQLLRRPQSFRGAAAEFLIDEKDEVESHLQTVRTLLGGLLAALQGGGREFGRQFIQRLSPLAIEDVVAGEGKGGIFGKTKEHHCWEKYKQLAEEFSTAELIERRLKDCQAAFVEKTVLGGR
jgi:hypothetical protein